MALYKVTTKEAVMLNLETALNTVTGIQFVDWQRIYNQAIDKDKYPGCYLNDIRVDKTKMLSDITKNNWSIGIIGWIWADETLSENVGTKLNTFYELIKDAIVLDRSRNSNVYTTNIDAIMVDPGSHFPQGMFSMLLTIIFYSVE